MMKKYIWLLLSIFMVTITSTSFAKDEFENNKRYVKRPIGMGVVSYIDTASVAVQKYNPPEYIITINAIQRYYDMDKIAHTRSFTYKFKYDYKERKMYIYSPGNGSAFKERYLSEMKWRKKPIDKTINWNSDWQFISPDIYYGEGTSDRAIAGEIAFAIAYNLKFHGEKFEAFQDGFYNQLPNASKMKDKL